MILSEQKLVDTLRHHCDNAKHRIWIATPYIGTMKEVCQIIGDNWKRSAIDFRILTDTEAGFIREDTYNMILQSKNSEIRSLASLHAKIYIVDDWCLLTSANLTGTAFSRRYEIGSEQTNLMPIETIFNQWWKIASSKIDIKKAAKFKEISEYQNKGISFSIKWGLPTYKCQNTKEIGGNTQEKVSFTINEKKLRNFLQKKRQSKSYTKICKGRSIAIKGLKQALDYDNGFKNIDIDAFFDIHELGKLDQRCKEKLKMAVKNGSLKKLCRMLCSDKYTPSELFDLAFSEEYKVKWCGENMITKILAVHNPKEYLVWNGHIKSFLQDFNLKFNKGKKMDGCKYHKLCIYFKSLCKELNIRDFTVLDQLLW